MSSVNGTVIGVTPPVREGRLLTSVISMLDDGLYPCVSGECDLVAIVDHKALYFKDMRLVNTWRIRELRVDIMGVSGTVELRFSADRPKEHPGQSMTHKEWCAAVAQDGQRNAGTCQCDECDS